MNNLKIVSGNSLKTRGGELMWSDSRALHLFFRLIQPVVPDRYKPPGGTDNGSGDQRNRGRLLLILKIVGELYV
jgi:hypothetical protein